MDIGNDLLGLDDVAGDSNWSWLASFLSNNAGSLGSLASILGGGINANTGANAVQTATGQQANALNRSIDLQTAQWMQQQANQAPWMEAGREALGHMQGRMAWSGPERPGATAAISGKDYEMPGTTPGWSPQMMDANAFTWTPGQGPQASQYGYQGPAAVQAQNYTWTPGQGPQAQNYTWTPGQGPQAQNFRYTPGQTPDAAAYQSGPPQLYRGAMPGTQVSQLTGQQVLDQDPGAAFRQTEARKALEGSAAAKGGLLSGSTLGAIQRQSQDLASQEYGNAWQRMMAKDTEQYGRNWGQYQQAWNQGVQGTQLGLQTNAQNFGQAMGAAQLREQVNQQAQQMGWNQAQAEAAFREQMAQASSAQGFGQAQTEAAYRNQMGQQAASQNFQQALSAQGQQWQQGMAGQQYDWQRAQQEAVFREQMAQTASKQGWDQALQGQQWNQGQQQQWQQEQYQRQMQQMQQRYGMDVAQNTTDYQRQQQAYSQEVGELQRQWNQFASLAGLGQTATTQLGNQGLFSQEALGKLYGQLGSTQAMGTLGQAGQWQGGLNSILGSGNTWLKSLNA